MYSYYRMQQGKNLTNGGNRRIGWVGVGWGGGGLSKMYVCLLF